MGIIEFLANLYLGQFSVVKRFNRNIKAFTKEKENVEWLHSIKEKDKTLDNYVNIYANLEDHHIDVLIRTI